MNLENRVLIGNVWKETNQKIEVRNPFNNEIITECFYGRKSEIEDAIKEALKAFRIMRVMPAFKRAEILKRTADIIAENKEDFAKLISLEAGKPISAAKAEVDRSVTTFLLASEEATRIYGEVLPLDISAAAGNRMGITRRFPLGVIAAITPFNFPLNLVAHKIAPALAAGNSVVHKPSSSTPLTALKLGQALLEAGMPEGAVNVVPCSGSDADSMVVDERIGMISFTGSPEVGWGIKSRSGRKKVALELGGNAAVVIEPDSDIEAAATRCVAGGYAYSGQVCISLQRIYVHEKIYDQFKNVFVEKVKAVKTGDPALQDTVAGPLITEEEVKRVGDWVLEAADMGGKILAGGTREKNIYMPTVLEKVPKHACCVKDEIFGPVTVLFPYNDFDEAIDKVNDSVYGLQAGVFSRDMGKALKAFNKIEAGGVMINEVPTFRVDNFPYGGIKNSGFGREGVKYAVEEMTEIKIMVVDNVM